jgi:nucleotide-binding universal stress UspA family protein
VVGVDGSPTSATALSWAIDVASRYDAALDVLHAWTWEVPGLGVVAPDKPAALADLARRTVDAQLQRVLADRPSDAAPVQAQARTVEGDPSPALVSAAATADLLVLGRHGQSALARRLLGPTLGHVPSHCLAHSTAPVAVVPDGTPAGPPSRVVVGVDGSQASRRVLPWAVAHAESVGAPLVAVLAWQLTSLPAPASSPGWAVPPLPEWQAAAERLLRETVEAALPAERAAAVEQVVLHEPAAAGLIGVVGPSDLLVLGDRGRGGFARLMLGSVSRQCAEHAPCAVVVVPPRHRADGPAPA